MGTIPGGHEASGDNVDPSLDLQQYSCYEDTIPGGQLVEASWDNVATSLDL